MSCQYFYLNIFMKYIIKISFLLNIVLSQSSIIVGTIKDSNNQYPLVGANIFIKGTSLGTASSDNGIYEIVNISAGTYTLKATYIGYDSKELEITIINDQTLEINIELDYKVIKGQAIEVTAQAKGQMDAINKQLNSASIKNIISSDKIQELPDANAAEALARVPGLSIKREGGEGNKVVIRGLSPKYNKVTINGINVASTDKDNRSTDVSTISQYLLDGIEVTKAGTPDLDGDALGGTVNFSLKKAETGLQTNILTQGIYNSLEKNYNNYKYLLTISNRFYKDKLGIIIQVDTESRSRDSHSLGGSYSNTPAFLDTINALYLRSAYLNDIKRRNERLNHSVSFDYNIPNGEITFFDMQNRLVKEEINFIENKKPNTKYDDILTRLKLKQAFGRLTRQASDRGIFIMLDRAMPSRLLSAFPKDIEIQRLGLAESIKEVKKFLSYT